MRPERSGRRMVRWALVVSIILAILPRVIPAQTMPELPFSFIENRGQWDAEARYMLDCGGLRAWFTAGGVTYDLEGDGGRGHVLRQHFVDARAGAPEGEGRREGRWNFIGGGAHAAADGFAEVRYRALYEGIDARYYEHEGRLKYDLLLAPGADPGDIRFTYDGAGAMSLLPDGSLRIATSVGDVREAPPYCYQEIGGVIHPVACRFTIDRRGVGFLAAPYNRSHPLVIDPALIYAGYLGGGGADEGRGITLDNAGYIYVTGSTRSKNFPTTPGAYRRTVDPVNPEFPSEDAFVVKLDPTGSMVIYGTYINGRGDDRPSGIVVQSSGVAVIAGTTFSADFETTPGAFDRDPAGIAQGKGFVLGLSRDGRSLVFSTYFGGAGADVIESIALGGSDNIYIAGWTRSRDFPTTPGALAPAFMGGIEDGFVARFGEAGGLRYSTYIGGAADERIASIVVEPGGRAWITGWTTSSDFPADTLFGGAGRGGRDCFITSLLPDLAGLFSSMLIGGAGDDEGRSIAVRATTGPATLADTVYVTGRTASVNYPIIPGSLDGSDGSWLAVKVMLAAGAPQLIYSRRLGDADDGYGATIQADRQGSAMLAGTGRFVAGDLDLRFIRLDPVGDVLLDTRVRAASDDTLARQSFLSDFGDLFVTGATRSADFPVTSGAFDIHLNDSGEAGRSDAFVLRYGFLKRPAIQAPPLRRFDTVRCPDERLDTFLVRNTGDDTLVINNHGFTSGGDIFTVVEPDLRTGPFRIPPGGALRYVVRYMTARAGADSARLQIFSNDLLPGHNPLEIRYLAVRVLIDAVPPNVSFGAATACDDDGGGEVKRSVELTITPAVRARVRLQLAGTSGAFSFAGPQSFELNGSAGLTLYFTPSTPGDYRDTLLVFDADCPEPLRVPLEGTGVPVPVSLAERDLHFPPLFACAGSVDYVDTSFTVVNDGVLPVTVEEVELIDPGFSVVTSLPVTVPPKDSRAITLRFTRGVGPDTVVGYPLVRIRECGRRLPLPILGEVRGRGMLGALLELRFGEITGCRGEPGHADSIVTIENRGDAEVTVDTVLIEGENGDDFAIGASLSLPLTLGAPGTAPLPVLYTPQDTGSADAVLLILYSSGSCTDTLRVRLSGRHVLEKLEPLASIIEVPALSECSASHDTIVVLHNRSGAPVVIERVLRSNGLDAGRSLPAPFTIPAGGTITDTVGFAPRQGGMAEETITYVTATCRDSITVRLRGSRRGLVPGFLLDSLVIPPLLSCSTGAIADTLVLIGSGDAGASATIVSARVIGGGAFELAGDPAGHVIAVGDSLRIPVRFMHAGTGSYAGVLQVVFDPCGDTLLLPMAATVVEPSLAITGGRFGQVPVGRRGSARVVIVNRNGVAVLIDHLDGLVTPFSIIGGDDLPAMLEPGDSLELLLGFAPAVAATYAPTPLVVAAEPCGFSVPMMLEGTGIIVADTLGFCLEHFASGQVGDTVELRLQQTRPVVLPGDGLYYLSYDRRRLQFVGTFMISGNGPQIVAQQRGGVTLRQAAGEPAGDIILRFRLLAGLANPALVLLDSVRIDSDTLAALACNDSARIFISAGCLVTGVQLGAFKNLLEPIRPNPAGGWAEVTWQQLESTRATIRIFDVGGREVQRPFDAQMDGGRYTIRFSVAELPSGSYYYHIDAGSYSETRRLVVRR